MPEGNCSDSYSSVFGYLSIYCWLVAQIPQQVENYRNKRCEGISPIFLILWFLGDLTSLIGCIMTNQLPFQIYLAIYFLYNDFVLCAQWYYYTFIYKGHRHRHHHHHHHHHQVMEGVPIENESHIGNCKDRKQSFVAAGLLLTSTMTGLAQGAPILDQITTSQLSDYMSPQFIGMAVSWICAFLYLGARIPQLYKNYKRKSVDGISPLLFFTLIVANLCYTVSILLNCRFSKNYLINELPYILGSSGTVFFDLIYFHQRNIYRVLPDSIDENTRLLE